VDDIASAIPTIKSTSSTCSTATTAEYNLLLNTKSITVFQTGFSNLSSIRTSDKLIIDWSKKTAS